MSEYRELEAMREGERRSLIEPYSDEVYDEEPVLCECGAEAWDEDYCKACYDSLTLIFTEHGIVRWPRGGYRWFTPRAANKYMRRMA